MLADPARVIVDVPDLQFKFSAAEVPAAHGLVTAWRYGLFATRKSRVVLDLASPAKVERAQLTGGQGGQPLQFVIDLVATDAATFEAAVKAQRPEVRPALKATTHEELPAAAARLNTKPVIVVDAGHGGIDPGAVSRRCFGEERGAGGGQAGARHPAGDRQVRRRHDAIDRRLRLARPAPQDFAQRLEADLFISIHADSIGAGNLARACAAPPSTRCRSRPPTSRRGCWPKRRTPSDLLAGLERGSSEEPGSGTQHPHRPDEARDVEFLRRFSRHAGWCTLKPARCRCRAIRSGSAAFKVLKQTQTPSVLIELGYMSNAQDAEAAASAEWQRQVGARHRGSGRRVFRQAAAQARWRRDSLCVSSGVMLDASERRLMPHSVLMCWRFAASALLRRHRLKTTQREQNSGIDAN